MGTATAAAVAGCLGREDTGGDGTTDASTTVPFEPTTDLPYGEWLATADDAVLFAYADLDAVPDDLGTDMSLDESLDDPLVTYPLVLNQTVIGLGQLQLSFAGLTSAIAPETDAESTVNEVTVLDEVTVAEGSFATDAVDELLVEPASETWGIAYEQTDRVQGYDQYEPAEIPDSYDGEPPVVAVSEETVVVGPDASRVQTLIAGRDDGEADFFEGNEAIAELFEVAGAGDLVVGEIGSRSDNPLGVRETFDGNFHFEPRAGEDSLASLAFEDSGDTISSQFALSAADLTEDRRETIESAFGTAAAEDSVSVSVDDNQITADATYTLQSLGLTNDGASGTEGLSQTDAAELVSPDALAFQYEPPAERAVGELWVSVTEDTDAAALRVEAASGGYTEFRPQERPVEAGDSVSVRVDPDGDSVTISVINGEGAVGELTSQSVPTSELSETTADQAVPADALSFSYESPDSGEYGSLEVEVVADIDAETLLARPQNAPGVFTDRTGSLTSDTAVETGTTLTTAVSPDGDEVAVYATVDDATGVVARWEGP